MAECHPPAAPAPAWDQDTDCGSAPDSSPAPQSRSERRRRKSAPVWLRLQKYLGAFAGAGGGCWKACPSYQKLARLLNVSQDTLSRAFRELERRAACPLAFMSGFTGPGGTRQKLFALKSWLKHDRRPLHWRKDGSRRGIRPSFRRGEEALEAPAPPAPPESGGGNSGFCRPLFIEERLSSADNPQNPPAPPAELSKVPEKSLLSSQAWRAAREAKDDGELFWQGSLVQMPLPALKTLILEALERGLGWRERIRPALRHALHEAHAAARLSEAVRNPGGFAAAVFRARLAGRGRRLAAPAFAASPSGLFGRAVPAGNPPPAPAPPPLERCVGAARSLSAPEREAVRRQAGSLAAMMRAALTRSFSTTVVNDLKPVFF